MQFGYQWAFAGNALSFLVSAFCISRLFLPDGFRPPRRSLTEAEVVRPWHEYREGLRYMRSVPLILGLLMVNIGWATGGGAAQILFSVFGEIVFNRGPAGLGMVWGCAGIGLLCGGAIAYTLGQPVELPELQTHDRGVLHRARRFVYPVQPVAELRLGAGLHRAFARRGGGQLGAQYVAAAADRPQLVSRAGVFDDGIVPVVGDDALDDGRRDCVAILGSADDRGDCRRAQLHDRDILGLGPLDRPLARAGPAGCGSTGNRDTWRANSLVLPERQFWLPAPPSGSAAVSRCGWRKRARGSRSIISRSETEARRTAEECGGADLFRADLESVPQIERMFHGGGGALGRLDGLVNNAARFTRFDPLEITEKDWDFIHSVNLKATFFCCQQGARLMRQTRRRPDRQYQLARRDTAMGGARPLLRIEGRRDHADARRWRRRSPRRLR